MSMPMERGFLKVLLKISKEKQRLKIYFVIANKSFVIERIDYHFIDYPQSTNQRKTRVIIINLLKFTK